MIFFFSLFSLLSSRQLHMINQEILLGVCWIQTCATDWQAKDFIIRTDFTHKILHSYSHMFLNHLSRRKQVRLKNLTVEYTLELRHIRPLIHPEYFVQILESLIYYEYSELTIVPSENVTFLTETEQEETTSSMSPGTQPQSTPRSSSEPSPSIYLEDTSDPIPSPNEENFDYLPMDTRPSPNYSPTPSF